MDSFEQMILPDSERLFGDKCIHYAEKGGASALHYQNNVINHTNRELYVVTAEGLITEIKPARPLDKPCIIIGSTRTTFNSGFKIIDGHECEQLNKLRQHTVTLGGEPRNLYWEDKIELTDMNFVRFGAFDPVSNICVYDTLAGARECGHPLARQSQINQLLRSPGDEFNADSMINVTLSIVDNKAELPTMYTIFHDRVLPLTPVKNPSLKDGLYVVGLVKSGGGRNTTRRQADHYYINDVFEGKSPFALYGSQFEATSALNETRRKVEVNKLQNDERQREHELALADNKREIERLKIALEREKQLDHVQKLGVDKTRDAYEMQMLMVKSQQDLLADERKLQREYELLKMKQETERQSHELSQHKHTQSIFTETVKTVGIVLTAGLALWKIFG